MKIFAIRDESAQEQKDLKRLRLFKVLLQIALLHRAIPEKHQQAMILQR